MDPTQAKIIELLREIHVLAFKEIERLNLRIAELENEHSQPTVAAIAKPAVHAAPIKRPSPTKSTGMLNERQVAEYLNMSLGSLRRWRLFRKGPKYLKIGSAVRYRREDVDAWLNSNTQPG